MKVSVDPGLCQGHGRCYTLVPRVFEDDADGYAQVKIEEISDPQLQEDARRAVGACPEVAIRVLDSASPHD
ncbi:ferredoxin [Rhodococcus aetherivorans]